MQTRETFVQKRFCKVVSLFWRGQGLRVHYPWSLTAQSLTQCCHHHADWCRGPLHHLMPAPIVQWHPDSSFTEVVAGVLHIHITHQEAVGIPVHMAEADKSWITDNRIMVHAQQELSIWQGVIRWCRKIPHHLCLENTTSVCCDVACKIQGVSFGHRHIAGWDDHI